MHISNNPSSYTTAQANSTSSATKASKSDFASMFAVAQDGQKTDEKSVTLDTSNGKIKIDIEEYFTPQQNAGPINLKDVPLLMPSKNNIEALKSYASDEFKTMMADYGIPEAPSKISYDAEGEIQFPADYPYTDKVKNALDENPALERAMRTASALTSHYVAIQERMPFIEAMNNAQSQAVIDMLIAKYSHLLNDNHDYQDIALAFSKDGDMSITADNKPYDDVLA